MKRKKQPAKSKRKPRVAKRGVAAGSSNKARNSRRRAIVATLKPLQGSTVRNIALNKHININKAGISETAYHGSKDELSTIASMDAKRQLRNAKPVATSKAKMNRRQREMRIKTMKRMRGRIIGGTTNVNVGELRSGRLVMYSITAKKKEKEIKSAPDFSLGHPAKGSMNFTTGLSQAPHGSVIRLLNIERRDTVIRTAKVHIFF